MWALMACIAAILAIAIVMSMTGRGGGNFYVPVLIAFGVPMLQAATTAQSILLCTALASALVFQKNRNIDWKLALVIDPPTDVMALVGGFYAHMVPGNVLKYVFAVLLVLAGLFMLRPVRERQLADRARLGFWRREFRGHKYVVNLWLTLPITAVAGLAAGMVGISCGSFKVPLMVLACGVPMRIAIGTSSAMVAATALMGLLGHSAAGDFNVTWAIPLSIVAVVGGLAGGALAVRTKAEHLKKIFAYSTLVAAAFMVANATLSGVR